MIAFKAKNSGKIYFGKHSIKFAVLEDGRYIFSDRDISFFIGGRGGKDWLSLSAKNLQSFISPSLKNKLINHIPSIFYGYEASTVIEICQVWIDAYYAGKLLKSQNTTYLRAKTFYESLSHIGIYSLANEVILKNPTVKIANNRVAPNK